MSRGVSAQATRYIIHEKLGSPLQSEMKINVQVASLRSVLLQAGLPDLKYDWPRRWNLNTVDNFLVQQISDNQKFKRLTQYRRAEEEVIERVGFLVCSWYCCL